MLFSSQPFILGFLPIMLGGFFLLGRLGGKTWPLRWLAAASLFFYAWWNPPFLVLLAGSVIVNYWVGQRILALARADQVLAARRWLAADPQVDRPPRGRGESETGLLFPRSRRRGGPSGRARMP